MSTKPGQLQIDYGRFLRDQGYDVTVRGTNHAGPDLIVNGIEYELKTLGAATQGAVLNNVEKVLKSRTQGFRVIIDGRGVGLTLSDARQAVVRIAGNSKFKPMEEVVIDAVGGRVVWP